MSHHLPNVQPLLIVVNDRCDPGSTFARIPRELRSQTLVSSCRDSSCHQRLVKLSILGVIEVRIMPQQSEIAAISQRPALEDEHQVQRLIGVAQP